MSRVYKLKYVLVVSLAQHIITGPATVKTVWMVSLLYNIQYVFERIRVLEEGKMIEKEGLTGQWPSAASLPALLPRGPYPKSWRSFSPVEKHKTQPHKQQPAFYNHYPSLSTIYSF